MIDASPSPSSSKKSRNVRALRSGLGPHDRARLVAADLGRGDGVREYGDGAS